MTRELKFRAWDPTEKRMITDANEGLRIYLNGSVAVGDCYAPELILMQFTGLKDSFDKDIYEGDIIRTVWASVRMGEDGLEAYTDVSDWIVEWQSKGGWFPFFDPDNKGPGERGWKIIGNQFENPELLK